MWAKLHCCFLKTTKAQLIPVPTSNITEAIDLILSQKEDSYSFLLKTSCRFYETTPIGSREYLSLGLYDAMFSRLVGRSVRWLTGIISPVAYSNSSTEKQDDGNDTDATYDTDDDEHHGPYEATVLDVLVVKAMLTKALNLPPEIVDSIVDLAEYWPHTTTEISYVDQPGEAVSQGVPFRGRTTENAANPWARRVGGGTKDITGGRPDTENQFLLRSIPLGFIRSPYSTPDELEKPAHARPVQEEFEPEDFQNLIASPVPTITHPCRKIVFTIVSHDQGWGGHYGERGTYRNSWTWFEAGLERCIKTSTTTTTPTNVDNAVASGSTSGSSASDQSKPTPSFSPSNLGTISPEIVRSPGPNGTEVFSFNHPLAPREEAKIHCNVTVDSEMREHRVVWSYTDDVRPTPDDDPDSPAVLALAASGRGKATGDGEFVRNLKLGDVVTVWAMARFPGWSNHIERVKVEVHWVV
ncbi:hypothetical protein B0H66DRAFT_544603 [Apodospora peruviana]|uniref:Uncharacterized protein n=1 Tax=Apodospora peruviana TaxID=516989 RepID=A0AAE0IU86_9PEZI|nr:hypothetical protein B0H66DRAFT_544603 [Apodospora peruviana]